MVKNQGEQKKRIFLDYASSTPVSPKVMDAIRPWMESGDQGMHNWANPSALYTEALSAKEAVSFARGQVADFLSAQKKEIVFTSGGTESNNLALLGVVETARMSALHRGDTSFIPHIITTVIEHPSILEVCRDIERNGGEVTYIPVSEEGIVSPKDIRDALRENTVLVTVMYANNEIGTVQPIHDIGRVIKEWRHTQKTEYPYFHTDASQAGLYVELHVLKQSVDLLTLDGIKMYGPRGIGVLYVRDGTILKPIAHGGGQEGRVRSGTENVPAIVGMGVACVQASSLRESEGERLRDLRDYGISKILETFSGSTLNGSHTDRLPNNINICFPNLDAEFAVISLDVLGFAVSYSSSCLTLKEDSSSYVIESLGRRNCAESSLRFTLGRESTREDIDALVEALKKVVK